MRDAHFKVKEIKKDEDGNPIVDEEGGPQPIGLLPDIICDAKQWQWAGVAFGEEVLMLLQKSLKAHITKTGASQMRLWGKIRGTQ